MNTPQGIASLGRGNDSMLVHMTPQEVGGLQNLAMAAGGSLTINPHTGLPEAGFLSSLLPMLAGAAVTFFSGGTATPLVASLYGAAAGAGTGALQGHKGWALLGDALGGYGGAGLGSALSGVGATTTAGLNAGTKAAEEAVKQGTLSAGKSMATSGAGSGLLGVSNAGRGIGAVLGSGAEGTAARSAVMGAMPFGKMGLAATAAPTMIEMSKPPDWKGPEVAKPRFWVGKDGGYKGSGQLVYNPGTQVAAGQGQNPLEGQSFGEGQWSDTFPGQSPTIGAAGGGSVAHLAEGGSTSADMRSYYSSLLAPPSARQAPSPPTAMQDYMAKINSAIAPKPRPEPSAAPPPASTTPAIDTTAGVPNLTNINLSGLFGGMNLNGLRGMGVGNYRYDPVTQSFSSPTAPVNAPTASGTGKAAGGGIHSLMGGSTYAAGGRLLSGGGDGMSDSIPAVIRGRKPQRAALADGEFVIPADVVSHLGNGSTNAGAKRLYSMMDKVRHARTGRKRQAPQVNINKFLPR